MNDTLRKVGEQKNNHENQRRIRAVLRLAGKDGHDAEDHRKRPVLSRERIANSIQDIEVMNLKKTDVSKVIAAARTFGKYGPQRGVVMLRKLLRYLKESGQEIPFRWQDIKIPSVSQKKVEYLTEDELEAVLGGDRPHDSVRPPYPSPP